MRKAREKIFGTGLITFNVVFTISILPSVDVLSRLFYVSVYEYPECFASHLQFWYMY